MVTSESYFWDMYSTTMQALNFYYYLLITDEKNKSVSLIRFLNKRWLDYLKQKLMKSHDTDWRKVKRHYCACGEKLLMWHQKGFEPLLEGLS
jgi:hypothetical protein